MMTEPFLIDAAALTDFQRCRRRYLLARKWRPLRWAPKLLFDACLRQGILELGDGKPVKDVVIEATTRFMNTAAKPGLDVQGVDPYQVSLDWTAMLETVLHTLARRSPIKLTPVKSKILADGVEWVFLAHADEHGELHRTVTVDRYDEDRVTQEMHGWYVFGDMCVARKPMHLHFIEIGQMRDGRRHSPWVRAWQHEYINHRIKFQRKGNKALQGTAWKPVHLADSTTYDATMWVDAMAEEQMADTLIHDADVMLPSSDHVLDTLRQIKVEAGQMEQWERSIGNPRVVPMARHSCDRPLPCPFLPYCFAPTPEVDITGLGLYKPRNGTPQ
jgi:hypothetical protein